MRPIHENRIGVSATASPGAGPAAARSSIRGRLRVRFRRFLRGTRGGATAIAAAAVTVMTVGATALIGDHVWLVDQRDVLKTASDAAAVATTQEMARLMDEQPGIKDDNLKTELAKVAKRYVDLNLQHLPEDRLKQARKTLEVKVTPNRRQRTVDVYAEADLGGTLIARHLPLLDRYTGPAATRVESKVESVTNPIEVVLALDASLSMARCLNGLADKSWRPCKGGTRLSIVKRAATSLVDILEPHRDNRVAVGLVPWHTVVRLDSDTADDWSKKNWARYPTRRVYPDRYACRGDCTPPPAAVEQALAANAPEPWRGCLDSHRLGSVGTRASLPATTSGFLTLPSDDPFAQFFFGARKGAAYECQAPPLPANYSWQTCYHGQRLTRTNTGVRTWPPREPQYDCPAANPAILPLSADRDEIVEAIDGLAAVGRSTYSGLGVLWSQRLLQHGWKDVWGGDVHPVDPDAKDSNGLRKAIVLLTDGEDSYCGFGTPTCPERKLAFSRADACNAAKAAGTEIFVIAAMHPNKVSAELGQSLRECSSESKDSSVTYAYLNHSTPDELEATFDEIATQLREVRRVY